MINFIIQLSEVAQQSLRLSTYDFNFQVINSNNNVAKGEGKHPDETCAHVGTLVGERLSLDQRLTVRIPEVRIPMTFPIYVHM